MATWAWGLGLLGTASLFVFVESRAADPVIPLSLFRNRVFVNATAIGMTLGIGMFAAIGFVPTFLQMSSGTSAAASGLLMLPMMVGLLGTSIVSGLMITKTGRYRIFPIVGTVVTALSMVLMTTLAAATPIWLICVYLFVFGAGLGLIMQVVVLVVQNAVPATEVGTATSTNNYFREVGASLGVAVFGTLFTTRLTENLTQVFTDAGATAAQAGQATATIDPAVLNELPEPVREGVVTAYADALAPVFWYLLPFIGVALLLSLFLEQIPLSDVAGLVARGEAIGGEEAERLETEERARRHASHVHGVEAVKVTDAPEEAPSMTTPAPHAARSRRERRLQRATALLDASDIHKSYGAGANRFDALKGVSLRLTAGESVAIVGRSGSGKSTLMHILALLDEPDHGAIMIEGRDAARLRGRDLDHLRNQEFGFVFQQFFLIPSASVLDNVVLPLKIAGVGLRERSKRGMAALRSLELDDKAKNKATALSGGQKQRVVIARALVNDPKVIFADEPTGNLDTATGAVVEDILFRLNRDHGITLVIVTHDLELAARCDRRIFLRDGLEVDAPPPPNLHGHVQLTQNAAEVQA